MATLHATTIADTEAPATAELLANFESALDDLLAKAGAEADEIGGYFRGPGIRYSLRKILASKRIER